MANCQPGETLCFQGVGIQTQLANIFDFIESFSQQFHDDWMMNSTTGNPQLDRHFRKSLHRLENGFDGNCTKCGRAIFHTQSGDVDMVEIVTICRFRQRV